jgi:broad specificity phosphatase PhoE
MKRGRLSKVGLATALFFIATGLGARAADDPKAELWALLKEGGQVLIMRHSMTSPETLDPPGSKLGDCNTQRNLSDIGKQTARYIGEAIRAHGVPVGRVLSSPWCRCLDTGRLAFGRAERLAELESLGEEGTVERERREAALRKLLGAKPAKGNTVLITHTYVISPLVGIGPVPAGFVVVTPLGDGSFRVAGQISPADIH